MAQRRQEAVQGEGREVCLAPWSRRKHEPMRSGRRGSFVPGKIGTGHLRKED